VVHICCRLDGIPLALELAAARTSILTFEQIARRLNDRFRLLTGGSRDTLPRHQTLQSLIDWSYDLLSAEERVLFQRLSVFAGSWTLEAAETVCSPGSGEIVNLLNDLVDKSLVLYEVLPGGEGRFRMLESVREYAHFKLLDSSERETLRARHRDFYSALMEAARTYLNGPEQIPWLDRLERERDNLRVALTYCQETPGQVETGLRIAAALQPFWWMRGPLGEARTLYSSLLAHPEAQGRTAVRADALHGAGGVASLQGDHPLARALWEESLAIRRELGDGAGSANALMSLAMVAKDLGDIAGAHALYTECLKIQEGLGIVYGRANALAGLGQLAANQGDLSSARARYSEALAIHREAGNLRGIAVCLGDLGAIVRDLGEPAVARSLMEESLALQRDLGNRTGVAILLCYLGQTATDQGDYAAAHAHFEECLTIQQELGNQGDIAVTLEAIAVLTSREERQEAAAGL
jgi:tetratricopeptide (TPR) repeat protein